MDPSLFKLALTLGFVAWIMNGVGLGYLWQDFADQRWENRRRIRSRLDYYVGCPQRA